MHYYRYRPYSEISLKELMYNEMYFSSPEECNDPFDSKTFYVFNDDKNKWEKLIQFASERLKIQMNENLSNELSQHICRQCPLLTFEEATNKNLFNGFIASSSIDNVLVNYLSQTFHDILKIYRPATRFFVSFSKTNSESLMWSHYADKHKGFCLIFKAIEGAMNLSPNHKKEQIRRETPNGLSPEMSFGLPDFFKFIDIDYKPEVEFLNAFLHLPVYVSGDAKNEEERLNIITDQERHYSQKGHNWIYENESRLILPPPPSWLFGGHIDYTKQERLFHYEPSQLAGIIYGARMIEQEKNRVREILKERDNWIDNTSNYKRITFRFIEFEAKLSTNQRNVEVLPISIMGPIPIRPSDTDFERLYAEWKEGIGHERDGNRSKRIKVD
jgi:hypothetical protein